MWKIAGVTDELWNVDGRRQAAKWKGRICSPAILMENRGMILQTDASSWFVNLSEPLRQADMNRNTRMTLQPRRFGCTSILTAGKVRRCNTNPQISIKLTVKVQQNWNDVFLQQHSLLLFMSLLLTLFLLWFDDSLNAAVFTAQSQDIIYTYIYI